ncbi:MAG: hypothetical protein IJD92_03025 [Bacilli bacterium]|nr:hypothetical protein [Bacilli bacterium]
MLCPFYFFDEKERELENIHCDIIFNISKLFKELNTNNIYEIFYIYCYLLWNGYFSVDKIYMYDYKDILDEDNTIFLGKGCCRHNSSLLTDVLRYLEFNSTEVSIRTINVKLDRIINDIKRIHVLYGEKEEKVPKNLPNHSVVLVKQNSSLLLDSTALTCIEVLNKGKLYCPDGKYKINRKLFLNEINKRNINFESKSLLSKEVLKNHYFIAKNIIKDNKNLIEDFYNDNNNKYNKVKELVKKI